MSTAMNFGSKSFKPTPPEKGAFPLDHFGECTAFKEKYMKCLRENRFENALCRLESKEYLESFNKMSLFHLHAFQILFLLGNLWPRNPWKNWDLRTPQKKNRKRILREHNKEAQENSSISYGKQQIFSSAYCTLYI
uniref:Cytochrome c oxidase assembly factor COX19 n=1 Tax=Salvator merianae TaxID=96440 RepID=A0A8D0E4B0_SALMN